MFFFLGSFLFVLYVYNNYMDIIYLFNNIYRTCNDYIGQYLNCKFKDCELKNITLGGNQYIFYEYSYNKNNYIIISELDKFTKTPYNIDNILKLHNSKSTVIHTKDLILMADAKTKDNKEIDVLDIIHKLCGPLGNFYKNTVVELDPKVIKLYIEKIKVIEITNLKLLSAIGEEINLI